MSCGITHRTAGIVVTAKETATTLLVISKGSECVAHSIGTNHLLGDIGCALEIVGSSSCDFAENDFLCRATSKQGCNLPFQIFAGVKEALLCRKLEGVTESTHATGHDRNLGHLAATGHEVPNNRVTNLVISNDLFLVVLHHSALFLKTSYNTFDRFIEIALYNFFLVITGR